MGATWRFPDLKSLAGPKKRLCILSNTEAKIPFRSRAQEKWMFANKPEMAKEWAAKTPEGAKLPERIGKQKTAAPAAKPSRFTPNKRFNRSP